MARASSDIAPILVHLVARYSRVALKHGNFASLPAPRLRAPKGVALTMRQIRTSRFLGAPARTAGSARPAPAEGAPGREPLPRPAASRDLPARPRYLGTPDGGRSFEFEATEGCRAREALLAIGVARRTAAELLEGGRVLCAGEALSQARRLGAGQRFAVLPRELPAAAAPAPAGSPADVSVLFEDEFVIVADKPQRLLVHGDGTGADTLTARVQALLDRRASDGSAPARRAQALQRLDVDTSGVVLFCKVPEFQPPFDALVAGAAGGRDGGDGGALPADADRPRMRKRYLALVEGAFDARRAVLRDPIARDRHDARRMRVSPTGQAALTTVELVGTVPYHGRPCSLLLVELGTGRRHQIRVHLAAHGHPVVGDALYGAGSPVGEGLMLHAWREEFVHPLTGRRVLIETPWPSRFPARPARI